SMFCPHCRLETMGVGGHCTNCGKPLQQRSAQVATGVLTPPPSAVGPGSNADRTSPAELGREPVRAANELTQLSPVSTGVAPGSGASRRPVTTGPLESGQAFGTRYHIIRPLGAGGM